MSAGVTHRIERDGRARRAPDLILQDRIAPRAVLATCLLAAAGAVFAQSSGGDQAIERHVIAGGGGSSNGGPYVLTGTIAQHDAHAASTGGDYALSGGFWVADNDAPQGDALFANGFE